MAPLFNTQELQILLRETRAVYKHKTSSIDNPSPYLPVTRASPPRHVNTFFVEILMNKHSKYFQSQEKVMSNEIRKIASEMKYSHFRNLTPRPAVIIAAIADYVYSLCYSSVRDYFITLV